MEDDILKQVQELETEFSSLQNSSLETERLLQDDEEELRNRLTKLEAEFVSYQNETLDKQRELEDEILKKQTNLERELYETNSRLTKVEIELNWPVGEQLLSLQILWKEKETHILNFKTSDLYWEHMLS